jgi:hypothetical protein
MILAVLLVIVMIALVGWPSSVYMVRTLRGRPFRVEHVLQIGAGYTLAVVVCVTAWWYGMRSGVRALEAMNE